MTMYERIKALRIKSQLSQDELAKLAGYKSRSMIGKIESGKVDLSQSKIKRFAEIFHISPTELMGLTKMAVSELAEEYGSKQPDKKIDIYKELQGATVLFNGFEYDLDEDKRKKIASYVKFALSDEDSEK